VRDAAGKKLVYDFNDWECYYKRLDLEGRCFVLRDGAIPKKQLQNISDHLRPTNSRLKPDNLPLSSALRRSGAGEALGQLPCEAHSLREICFAGNCSIGDFLHFVQAARAEADWLEEAMHKQRVLGKMITRLRSRRDDPSLRPIAAPCRAPPYRAMWPWTPHGVVAFLGTDQASLGRR
jgi:hypothetical protein